MIIILLLHFLSKSIFILSPRTSRSSLFVSSWTVSYRALDIARQGIVPYNSNAVALIAVTATRRMAASSFLSLYVAATSSQDAVWLCSPEPVPRLWSVSMDCQRPRGAGHTFSNPQCTLLGSPAIIRGARYEKPVIWTNNKP